MNKYKRRLGLILASMMMFILAGCAATSDSTIKQSAQPSNVAETAKPNSGTAVQATDKAQSTISPTKKTETANKTEVSKKEESSKVSSNLEVHFIDVGQGDSILLKSGDQTMLVDAGDNKYGKGVVSHLQNLGVKKLDYVVGTHPDADHIGGLDNVIASLDIGKVYMPRKQSNTKTFEDVLSAIAQKGLKINSPKVGSSFTLGSATVTVLGPVNTYDDNNNNSIILKVTHGENSFLLMGDAELEAEEDLVSSGQNLSATVLKAGHHGSHSSTSQSLLQKVKPTYAVISCGVNNKYGHPHTETMTYLKRANVKVYRTDEQQTIVMTSNGKNISTKTGEPSVKESSSGSYNTNTAGSGSKATIAPKTTVAPKETVAPSSGTYIGNKNTKKFHRSTCNSLPAEKNQVKFSSREEAVSAGYDACKRCNP